MKKINSPVIVTLLFTSFLCSSCELVKGIFEAGMSFGIFIVIAVIVLIVAIIFKLGNRN
ncbi:hypothetical protein [Flavobacterium sp. N3904]|uniref:hypothetical protein n=1 Tax=Flavobacterium sp. N3904 TaxID=2986835 RepID=UPI0022243D7E|nr:hypothetical protein [Flavobacterium sp. N3904]